jgi:radical SAM protein with 4Fe4S-binding SPASM domain
MAALSAVVAELIQQRRMGLPIVTSEDQLRAIPDHFLERKTPKHTERCRAGLRNYFIGPSGDVKVCGDFAPIGNVREQEAKAIWHGDEAQLRRVQTAECQKGCPAGCYMKRPLTDMIERARMVLRGSKRAEKS